MNIVFFDGIHWDYDVATPLERPLGGSQSALCYLAAGLAQRGHRVTLFSGTTRPGVIRGVTCLSNQQMSREMLAEPFDAFIVLNGPADLGARIRPHLPAATPLVLWTQHSLDQPAMQMLQVSETRASWDVIVCISNWHRTTMIQHYGLDPACVSVLRNAIGPRFENLFASPEDLMVVKSTRPILAYTSTPFRGLNVLLHIFPMVRQEWPDAELRVYSSMKVYQQNEAQDDCRVLYDQCRALPGAVYVGSLPQPELAAALRTATVLSYTNTFAETSCIAVMEALASGLFVVTSDLGALPETTLGFGILVPPAQGQADLLNYAGRYLAQLRAVLQRQATDPVEFAAERFEQVRAIQTHCTWRVRAAEWEAAIAGWREQKQRPRAFVVGW